MIGTIFIDVFYSVSQNLWIQTEEIWGAIFTLLASILITIISWIMIRINHWKDRMEKRFRYAARVYFERHNRENYLGLSLLSFTVVSREALEAFIFVAGSDFMLLISAYLD